MQATEENIMTIEEVADYLRVHTKTLYRLVKKGGIPAAKVGGSWRFVREHIDDWLDEQHQIYWEEQ